MKNLINKYKFLLIFIMLTALVLFFPLTGKSLFFKLYEIKNIKDFLTVDDGGLISNAFLLVFTRFKLIRVIIYGVISTAMFIFMKNIVNNKNSSLMFIAAFFFLLLDKSLFSASFVSLHGFTRYFIGSLFLIIILNIFSKNSFLTLKKSLLFILGLVGTSLVPVYSFVFFTTTLIYLSKRKETIEKKRCLWLLVGELLGIIPLILNYRFRYTGFSHNLLQEFMPLIRESNFIIILIMSGLLLASSVKIFKRGKRSQIFLAMLGIVSFLFSSLLFESNVLHYITFIFYTVGSIFLTLELKNTRVHQRKVSYYFLFKILTIVFLCIFGQIEEGSLLFLSLLDIMIILEIYDMSLPKDFLSWTWCLVFVTLASVNIYIYTTTLKKFDEMNFYIKNKLECNKDDHSLPNKYYTDYLYDYIPSTKDDLEIYIKYYGIHLFDNIEDINLHFKEEKVSTLLSG